MAATKCIKACRRGQEVRLFFRPNVGTRKRCDRSDFDRGTIVGARRGGLSISGTAHLLGDPRETVSGVGREWREKQKTSSEQQFCGQRRRARPVKADGEVTVMQITTHYSGTRRSISEHATHQTSKCVNCALSEMATEEGHFCVHSCTIFQLCPESSVMFSLGTNEYFFQAKMIRMNCILQAWGTV